MPYPIDEKYIDGWVSEISKGLPKRLAVVLSMGIRRYQKLTLWMYSADDPADDELREALDDRVSEAIRIGAERDGLLLTLADKDALWEHEFAAIAVDREDRRREAAAERELRKSSGAWNGKSAG